MGRFVCRIARVLGTLAALSLVNNCSKPNEMGANRVTNEDPTVQKSIGDGNENFLVLGNQALWQGIEGNRIRLASDKDAKAFLDRIAKVSLSADDVSSGSGSVASASSLVLGFPIGLLGEQQVFGGTITAVSDRENEDLGGLKLTNLDPIHVTVEVGKAGDKYLMALVGCANECSEKSEQSVLLTIPVLAVDEKKSMLMVDLATVAQGLNLIEILDPDGEFTKLKTKSVRTTAFDYSLSTLVFDIETTMVPINASPTPVKDTVMTARWFLKLGSAFQPAFVSRPATEGLGYFMTFRSTEPKIHRFSLTDSTKDAGAVKYFIKNVPTEFRPAIAGAFDEWNEKMLQVTGRKLLAYEFVEKTDPRHKLLIPGDPRYNIVEWDEVNKAGYGGLGPSIANQFTGQIMSANVLLQGPTIVEIYTRWFKTGQEAQALREEGRLVEAEALLHKEQVATQRQLASLSKKRFEVSLGKLKFNVHSQEASLEDPVVKREDFDLIPKGMTFATYMPGYFHDMVAHELGHNLGLRHNFRGNLSAKAKPELGGVSHSIMEYLGRPFRYLDRIGPYDVMAINYGYAGVMPERKDMFCTDEDVPDPKNATKSAECSRDDATADPFSFFEKNLVRGIDLLVARGLPTASSWRVADMDKQLTAAVQGLAFYATSAEAMGSKLSNFFTGGDRPTSAAGIPAYVASHLAAKVCDPSLAEVVAGKESADAKAATEANLKALRDKVKAMVAPLEALPAIQCIVE